MSSRDVCESELCDWRDGDLGKCRVKFVVSVKNTTASDAGYRGTRGLPKTHVRVMIQEAELARMDNQTHVIDSSISEEDSRQYALVLCFGDNYLPPNSTNGTLFCPKTFDGWSCWNETPPGVVAYVSCPAFVTGFDPNRLAHKLCDQDGQWFRHPSNNKTWSNYTTCVDNDDLKFRQWINHLYITGYSISATALIISLAIFFAFRTLKCTRICIHKNLFTSFVINNVMWIWWYSTVVKQPDVLLNSEVQCQVLHVFLQYFLVSNYMWMFAEGFYLHTVLAVAFVSEEKIMRWLYVIGWGLPIFLTISYGAYRSQLPSDTLYCWIEDSPALWILTGPVCLSMLLNLIFLVNIVRVLVTKLRAVNSAETNHTRKAVRATLILIPLLGLHYLITPFRPQPRSPGEALYETISAIVTSLQGFCVSLLFCFFNGEVIGIVRRKWRQARMIRHEDLRTSKIMNATVSWDVSTM